MKALDVIRCSLIELPVRMEERASIVRLRIERDGGNGHGRAEASWALEAALDLGAIGGLHARVTLRAQRVGVQLRAESPTVVEALSANAPRLEAMLSDAGLEVDRIVCLHGMPAAEAAPRSSRLLDVRA